MGAVGICRMGTGGTLVSAFPFYHTCFVTTLQLLSHSLVVLLAAVHIALTVKIFVTHYKFCTFLVPLE